MNSCWIQCINVKWQKFKILAQSRRPTSIKLLKKIVQQVLRVLAVEIKFSVSKTTIHLTIGKTFLTFLNSQAQFSRKEASSPATTSKKCKLITVKAEDRHASRRGEMDRRVIVPCNVMPVEIIDNVSLSSWIHSYALQRASSRKRSSTASHTASHTFPIKLVDWSDYREIYSPRCWREYTSR